MKRLAFAATFPSLTWPRLVRLPGYRVQVKEPRPGAPARDLGDLVAKVLIVTLFSSMAMRLAQDCARTGHVTGMRSPPRR